MLRYIISGKGNRYHERSACRSRARWHDLGWRKPAPIPFPRRIWDRFVVFL